MTEQPQSEPELPPPPASPAYAAPQWGPPAKPRSVGICILLEIVTLGIYGYFWVPWTHTDIKRHSGQGVGGGLGFVIYFLVAPVTFFIVPNEVQKMLQMSGRESRVSAITGLWILLPLAGPIVWFVKVQGQLNDYWESLGQAA
jgi:hypothetical protein